jgi:hypothetical protein
MFVAVPLSSTTVTAPDTVQGGSVVVGGAAAMVVVVVGVTTATTGAAPFTKSTVRLVLPFGLVALSVTSWRPAVQLVTNADPSQNFTSVTLRLELDQPSLFSVSALTRASASYAARTDSASGLQ